MRLHSALNSSLGLSLAGRCDRGPALVTEFRVGFELGLALGAVLFLLTRTALAAEFRAVSQRGAALYAGHHRDFHFRAAVITEFGAGRIRRTTLRALHRGRGAARAACLWIRSIGHRSRHRIADGESGTEPRAQSGST